MILEKIEGKADIARVSVEIGKRVVILICDGSFQPNMDENIGAAAWLITYIYIYIIVEIPPHNIMSGKCIHIRTNRPIFNIITSVISVSNL